MIYGKLIDGKFEPLTGRCIHHNGKIYSNPTEKTKKKLGYKPLVEEEIPDIKEGYYISATYSETDNEIIKSYEFLPYEDFEMDISDESSEETEEVTE